MRKAFTLIELLVVISIIALLIAILLPALGQAKESARAINCLANTRSIGQAAMNYAADYNQNLPGCNGRAVGNGNVTFPAWATRLLDYNSDAYDVYYCPSRGPEYLWERVMQTDPDKPAWANHFANDTTSRNYGLDVGEAIPNGSGGMRFSYGYNDWGTVSFGSFGTQPLKSGAGGNMWGAYSNPPTNPYVKTVDLAAPSEFFLLSDRGDADDILPPAAWRWNIDPLNRNLNSDPLSHNDARENPAAVHNGGSSVTFGDGHGERVDQKDMLLEASFGFGGFADTEEEAEIARHWNANNKVNPTH
ncbi:MAG: DUF1559 domain-containing protein [Planctomycetota bacterium]